MAAVACVLTDPHSSTSAAKATLAFGQEFVTLSMQAHIELVMQASYWRAQHGRAVERLEWQATQYRELLGQTQQREAALRSELQTAQAKIRDLQQRLFGRKTEPCCRRDLRPWIRHRRRARVRAPARRAVPYFSCRWKGCTAPTRSVRPAAPTAGTVNSTS